LRFEAAHRSRRGQQIRVCGLDSCPSVSDRNFVWLSVQLGENIAFVDEIIVIHQNPGYLAADASGDERDVPVHIGVVCRNSVESQFDPRNAEFPDCREHQCGRDADG